MEAENLIEENYNLKVRIVCSIDQKRDYYPLNWQKKGKENVYENKTLLLPTPFGTGIDSSSLKHSHILLQKSIKHSRKKANLSHKTAR